MESSLTLLGGVCLACVAASLTVIIHYLVRRPPLVFGTKMVLLLGLGVFPAGAAVTSTVTGMETTTTRPFCGSCHTMDPYVADASDPHGQSLAARHGRNPFFGQRNCYVCHANYGMLGYPLTKLNGMRHVYEYYLGGWRALSTDESLAAIHLQKPYDNTNCRQCHTGTLKDWSLIPEHAALAEELVANTVSCTSAGCHGYAHPFSKRDGASGVGLPPSAGSTEALAPGMPEEARKKLEAARDERTRREAEAAAEAERRDAARRDAARDAARRRSAPSATPSSSSTSGSAP